MGYYFSNSRVRPDQETCTFKGYASRVSIGLMDFDEAIAEKNRQFCEYTEEESEPEGVDIGLGVDKEDSKARHNEESSQPLL